MANWKSKINIIQPDPIIGTPEQDTTVFPGQQLHDNTCAIRCQEFIIEQFTGVDIPENTLMKEAQQHGWYTPDGGTSMENVGGLLELNGIPVNRYENANVFNLTSELAQGHKVIIGVDSDDLWKQNPIMDKIVHLLHLNQADHAVVVSGIDTSNPDDVRVIISDPGTGQAAASYPMNQFLEAWKDSNFYMVATQNPAPAWLPEMQNFDYGTGHLANVGAMTFAESQHLENQPDQWHKLYTEGHEQLSFGTEEHSHNFVDYHQDVNHEFNANMNDVFDSHHDNQYSAKIGTDHHEYQDKNFKFSDVLEQYGSDDGHWGDDS